MTIRCPACGRRVARQRVDIPSDRVTCAHCGKVASYRAISGIAAGPASRRGPNAASDAAAAPPPPSAVQSPDPGSPPAGAWFRDDGVTMIVGAHTRSIGGGIVLLLISGFWLSVNAMFLFGSIITILKALGFSTGQPGFGSLGGGLFMLFVSLLFGLGGWFIVSLACMLLAGRVEFTLRGDQLRVFTGAWMLGRRRTFSASAITAIQEDVRVIATQRSSRTSRTILIKHPPGKDVRVGDMLTDPRRRFVLGVLKRVVGR